MIRRDFLIGLSLAATAEGESLSQADSRAFDEYISPIEASLPQSSFWSDESPSRLADLKAGLIPLGPLVHPNPKDVGDSYIHDWVAAVQIKGAKAAQLVAVLQDFDRHKIYYQPDVVNSLFLGKNGDVFRSSMRTHKKKIMTVDLDYEYETRFFAQAPTRGYSVVHSVKISEVRNAGDKNETVLPPGTGHGFLWRMNSYWRWDERPDGLLAELRSISLTRDVPAAIAWMISGIITGMPRESLQFTLGRTRQAVLSQPAPKPA